MPLCLYYSENFKIVKSIVSSFDSEDAASIKTAHNVLASGKIEGNLAFIKSNFAIVSSTITSLEKQELELCDAINYIDVVSQVLQKARGKIAQSVAAKLNKVLEKNTGFQENL